MTFEINFNKEQDDELLEELGAKLVPTGATKYLPFDKYVIEIEGFKELEELLAKIDKIKNSYYSAIISFNHATIYLDDDI